MAIALLIFALFPNSGPENLTPHTLRMPASENPQQWKLSQLAFLQGAWSGTGFSAKCDETWSAPAGDCMLGTFRMVKDGQLQFTEFCMIQNVPGGGIVLKLKHFTPELVGWEKKEKYVSFPLIKIEGETAYFKGLTYSVQPDGSLKIWVAIAGDDGTLREESCHLQRSR